MKNIVAKIDIIISIGLYISFIEKHFYYIDNLF